MYLFLNNLPLKLRLGVVFAVVCLMTPLTAHSAGIAFRNDYNTSVVVQGGSVVNGMLRTGKPVVVHTRRIGWDMNLGVGVRHVTIYDANIPGRVLLRQPIRFEGTNTFYSIRPNTNPRSQYPVMLFKLR